MHEINVMNLTAKERYKLLSGTVIPRPIAFVTTRSTESGKTNAAPFSFFSMLAGDPPLLSIAVGRKKWNDERYSSKCSCLEGACYSCGSRGTCVRYESNGCYAKA